LDNVRPTNRRECDNGENLRGGIDFEVLRWIEQVDGTSSGPCPVAGFGFYSVEIGFYCHYVGR